MIRWVVGQAQGRELDYAAGQLGMAFAAIHTTTEALSAAIIDLCNQPEFIQPLRDEIVTVLKEEGWSQSALHKINLVDSLLKESQCMHPVVGTLMHRLVMRDIALSDGTILPRRCRSHIAGTFFDPKVYPWPQKCDAYRFLRMREDPHSGQSSTSLYTTTSPEHLGFGHGEHGCPGRFFASNELKIALSFLLLKYDWELESGPTFMVVGAATNVSPLCRVSLRGRKSEIEL